MIPTLFVTLLVGALGVWQIARLVTRNQTLEAEVAALTKTVDGYKRRDEVAARVAAATKAKS